MAAAILRSCPDDVGTELASRPTRCRPAVGSLANGVSSINCARSTRPVDSEPSRRPPSYSTARRAKDDRRRSSRSPDRCGRRSCWRTSRPQVAGLPTRSRPGASSAPSSSSATSAAPSPSRARRRLPSAGRRRAGREFASADSSRSLCIVRCETLRAGRAVTDVRVGADAARAADRHVVADERSGRNDERARAPLTWIAALRLRPARPVSSRGRSRSSTESGIAATTTQVDTGPTRHGRRQVDLPSARLSPRPSPSPERPAHAAARDVRADQARRRTTRSGGIHARSQVWESTPARRPRIGPARRLPSATDC